MEEIFNNGENFPEPLEKYAKREFGFHFRDWQQFSATAKINWICNCVKHYDSFPLKEPRPANCRLFPENLRLRVTSKEFKLDTEIYLQFCTVYLTLMFVMSSHRRYEKDFDYGFWKNNEAMLTSHNETVAKMKNIIVELINKIRSVEQDIILLSD